MKTFISKIAFVFLLQGFTGNLLAHVELDYPVGGESFTTGQTVTIQWHIAIAHNTLNWDLFYSSDGGSTWETIQMDLPPGSLSYTWTVPSNVTSQARVSVIQDNSAQDYQDESLDFNIVVPPMLPVIVNGAVDITIESNVDTQVDAIQDWLDNNGGASAEGFCGDLVWTNDYITLSNGCGSTGSALVTFTATDPCGSTETVATVTVNDTSPPVLNTAASPLVVECDGNSNSSQLNTWLQANAGANASDDGGKVNWSNNFSTLSNSCGSTGNATVIFSATDECGNHVESSASFAIVDTEAPTISVASQDYLIQCGTPITESILQNWLANHGGAQANDDCGYITWTNDFPGLPDTCIFPTIFRVTFTVVDVCGNTDSTSAYLHLIDGISSTSDAEWSDQLLKVYPNPVSDILKVEFAANENSLYKLTLFDAPGNPVVAYHDLAKEMYIPVKGFAPGVYFLHLETAHGFITRKVVIE